MLDNKTLIKNALLLAYVAKKAGKNLSRRQFNTYIYLLSKLTKENSSQLIGIYPDGVEHPETNIILDILRSGNLIAISRSRIKITKEGARRVEEMLSNPDDNIIRLNYRVLFRLVSYNYETILRMLTYFSGSLSDLDLESDAELLRLINDIRELLYRYKNAEKDETPQKIMK